MHSDVNKGLFIVLRLTAIVMVLRGMQQCAIISSVIALGYTAMFSVGTSTELMGSSSSGGSVLAASLDTEKWKSWCLVCWLHPGSD